MSSKEIEALAAKAPKVTIKSLQAEIDEILVRLDILEAKRNPASSREMTEDDARRVIRGDLAETSHKEAAKILGLSYGQVYSCRGGYTFKRIYNETNG
jgi:hypothetical protein